MFSELISICDVAGLEYVGFGLKCTGFHIEPRDFDNKSLIIVDDDNPFRERLSRAMEKKGFEVLQAESVKKGIDTVKAKKPGFAVVDLRLGDGNGLEVVKEIQESNSSSRIIIYDYNFKIISQIFIN